MLSRPYRLNQEIDITRTLRRGLEKNRPTLSLKYLVSGFSRPRFGFLVSKKISNRATERNLVKRRLREVVARLLPDVAGGYDCLFIARPAITGKSFEEIRREVIGLLDGARLLRPKSQKTP